MAKGLDEIDIKILKHLQKEGRAQRNQLAEIVHLSVPSVSERMRKLEENKLIKGYRAMLDGKLFKFDITAFVFVEVDGDRKSTRLNSSHVAISYAVFLLKKKTLHDDTRGAFT